jgi:hypothetical protein
MTRILDQVEPLARWKRIDSGTPALGEQLLELIKVGS